MRKTRSDPEVGYKRNTLTIQNEIAGAVATEALVDLRENLFGFSGFPSVVVGQLKDGAFPVSLICGKNDKCSVDFLLNEDAAYDAAKNFKLGKHTGEALFEIVQKALAELEAKSRKLK